MATINNVVASWSMIQLKIANTDSLTDQGGENGILIDATSVKWSTSRKVEDVYGLGGQSRGRGFGNVTYTASITLPYQTQDTLCSYSGSTLMALGNFDVLVSWVTDLAKDAAYKTVTLKNCFFSEMAMEANQDDTSITHEYDLHPYRIYHDGMSGGSTNWSLEMYAGK